MTAYVASGDVFNARDLQTKEVAETFLPPPVFERLLSNAHCILEGPRGSGKTTLLRMLTPEAFSIMRRRITGSAIEFIGVFVPADIRWAKQLSIRTDRISDVIAKDAIQQAVFSVAISLAVIESLENISALYPMFGEEQPVLFFHLDRTKEVQLIEALAYLWALEAPVPSLSSIKIALRRRQHELSNASVQLANGRELVELQKELTYLTSTWLDNLVTAIETINDVLERPNQRWAILLDELEIVPPSLLRTIVDALRSTSNLVRFKLAMVPTGSDLIARGEPGSSSHGEDYRPLKLWYEKKGDARTFACHLFAASLSRLLDRSFTAATLSHELGHSWATSIDEVNADGEEIDQTTASKTGTQDSESSGLQQVRVAAFASLYKSDESFRRVLDLKKIDPTNPPYSDGSANGILVRKITQLVAHRDSELVSFTTAAGAKRKGGRRNLDFYVGYPNLIDLTEGNPRWVLTLVEALVAASRETGHKLSESSVQGGVIRDFVQQMISRLRVYPVKATATGKQWTPYDFIESLGQSIATTLFDEPFITDPAMSFMIDQEAIDQFGSYIRTAIDLGALIIMSRGGPAPLANGSILQSLVGSRVRITYRLAPEFRLPLLYTKHQRLSTALRSGDLFNENNAKSKVGQKQKLASSTDSPTLPPIQGRLL